MQEFTYETDTPCGELETYEWDNVWWEHAPDHLVPRVLIVGDSISCGYRQLLNALLQGRFYVDGFASSKAPDHPCLFRSLELFVEQQRHTEILCVNSGLHGWHLPVQAYEKWYGQLLDELAALCPAARITVTLTTPVRNPQNHAEFDPRNAEVLRRNAAARRLAAQRGLSVTDLYEPLENRPELYRPDGVHLTEAGYQLLAERMAAALGV